MSNFNKPEQITFNVTPVKVEAKRFKPNSLQAVGDSWIEYEQPLKFEVT